MAGQLTIDTLKASSGVLATQNGMTGIAKAWVNFNMSTGAIRGSYNVGSVTKLSTGQWYINYTTAMPDANYSILGCCSTAQGNFSFAGTIAYSTTQGFIQYYNGGFADAPYTNAAVFSS